MADRGRDLKISILSDAERFDLAHPADELDNVADAAKGTGTALDRMGDDAKGAGDDLGTMGKDVKGAGDDLDTLAKDAKATADKVDSSFDAIAKASKAKMGKGMDDGAKSAKGSLKDVSSEAAGTARETAASFDGTASSVTGAFQEIAANALGAFGPIAAGIGLAAAAGIGILTAQAEKSKEAVSELVGTLVDQGGKLERANVLDQLKKFAQDGSLVDMKRQAQDAKIPVNDFLLAMAGDPEKMRASTDAVKASTAAIALANEGAMEIDQTSLDLVHNLSGVDKALAPVADNYKAAADAAAVYAAATGPEGAAKAQTAFTDALAGFVDPMSAFADALPAMGSAEQKAAAATARASKEMSDSWEDYAQNVDVSVDEYLASLTRQVTAQVDWEKNMTTLAGRVSSGTIEELAKLGPEGAPLVAKLATASNKELAAMDAQFKRAAQLAGDGFAAGLKSKEAAAAKAAARLRDVAAAQLKLPLVIDLALNDTAFRASLNAAVGALSKYPLLDPSTRKRP